MNIFWLAVNLVLCAQSHTNAHVVVTPKEVAQMLWTAYHVLENFPESLPEDTPKRKNTEQRGYGCIQKGNPFCVWTRAAKENFILAARYGLAVAAEYTYRYGKVHASQEHIEWLLAQVNRLNFPSELLTPIPVVRLGHPVTYVLTVEDAVEFYRSYYLNEKAKLLKFKNRDPPLWVTESKLQICQYTINLVH